MFDSLQSKSNELVSHNYKYNTGYEIRLSQGKYTDLYGVLNDFNSRARCHFAIKIDTAIAKIF